MWCLIAYSKDKESKDKTKSLDLDLCDEQGAVCIRIKGLIFQRQQDSMISMPSLEAENNAHQIIPHISDKPSGIVLQGFSKNQIQIRSQSSQISQSITLLKFGSLLSHPSIAAKNESVTNSKIEVSIKILQAELKTSLAEVLFMKEGDIDSDKQFIDMGMDSIVGVEWIRVINKQYGISITATKIYDYPNIREFSEFLKKELTKKDIEIQNNHSMDGQMISSTIKLSPIVPDNSKPYQPIESLKQSNQLRSVISIKSLQAELKISLAQALFMKEGDIDSDKQFIDMGMDSIVGVEWIQAINKQYGISITATKIYDYPNIREFSEFLKKELNKRIRSLEQAPLKSIPSLSLDEVLLQVEHGTIDIEQADQLFNEIII